MKFGKDFWFWVRLLVVMLKALLGTQPPNENPAITRGQRVFFAIAESLVEENEDDEKKASDLKALVRK